MNADQMLASKLNRMSEFSDIIDGYMRIENIDILTKNRLIDQINELRADTTDWLMMKQP